MTVSKRITALILCAALLLTGCGAAPAATSPATDPTQPSGEPVPGNPASSAPTALAEAEYPYVPQYPQEEAFTDPVTGELDEKAYFTAYNQWSNAAPVPAHKLSEDAVRDLPDFFRAAVPAFLSAGTENPVCSPLNIYMALALLARCTGGQTRQEILSLLGSTSAEALTGQARQIWDANYLNDGTSARILANSLWLDAEISYDKEAVNALSEDLYASVYQGDMGSPEMDEALREWINRQTQGLLKEQAGNLSLDPRTVLALASTIYYRAKWCDEFYAQNNTQDEFHALDGTLLTTFMHRTLSYGPYYWGRDFGAVNLKLEDGSRMWLILPDEGCAPEEVLASGDALELALGGYRETRKQKELRVNLSLPKFDVNSDVKLQEALKALGVVTVFEESADFSPILPGQGIRLNSVSHAARVKIDEEGVEAAAYTVMQALGAARPPEEEMDFILDRPFLFMICSREDLPLFAGIVHTP